MRIKLPKGALAIAIAIASTIGATAAIGQPVKGQTDPRRQPQAAGSNRYVMCLGQASGMRLLPGSEARKSFLNRCLRGK